ncbi:MAG: sulfatase-like hydrolase/transferase, partial [Opitutae bacterium]
MKSFRFLSLLALLACFFSDHAVADERPNIVFILGDDQSWKDYGFMGSEMVSTPHINALAENGLTFKRGYVAAP